MSSTNFPPRDLSLTNLSVKGPSLNSKIITNELITNRLQALSINTVHFEITPAPGWSIVNGDSELLLNHIVSVNYTIRADASITVGALPVVMASLPSVLAPKSHVTVPCVSLAVGQIFLSTLDSAGVITLLLPSTGPLTGPFDVCFNVMYTL